MSETLKNLAAAFIGESQARNRYTMYAKAAQKEGYEQIAAIFLDTAEQEREHASWLFKYIKQLKEQGESVDDLKVEAEVPAVYATTAENLIAAIAGENYEFESMYPAFADKAEEEGFQEIADRLRSIAKAEQHHKERYMKLLAEVQAKTVFKKAETKRWFCRKCGYWHEGEEAPETCPSCGHGQAFFQLDNEQY